MAPGFKFPPPPPPPPPKASNDTPNTYNSQRGGRGDRGHGRGVVPRGGNGGGHRGNSRGLHQQGGSVHPRGGHRGGPRQYGNRGGPQGHTHDRPPQQQQHHAQNISQASSNTNTNMNPVLTYPSPGLPNVSTDSLPQAPLDPGAFIQAMAFMATPAGMQSMAAFANHMSGGGAMTSCMQPTSPQQPISHAQTSPPQPESRKRKRGDRVGEWQAQQRHAPAQKSQSQKPPRAKAKAAPAVPGFGFSLPPLPSANNQDKKRTNLGLTHMDYDKEDSEEDGTVDEEAAFAAKWDGQGITFEHRGDLISLQTGAEVAAYIKDRKRNFPTQARIEEKAQKAVDKRAQELEFLRRVRGTSKKEKGCEEPRPSNRRQKKDAKKFPAPTQPSLDELREKVKQSISAKQVQAVDLGLGYASDTDADSESEIDEDSSILSESSVISSSESSDSDSDDDAPPETQSSKKAIVPTVRPPPPKVPNREATDLGKTKTQVCSQWRATGKCKYTYCRYKHVEEEPRFVGLYERMVELELENADKLALEVVKYLGRNGFLG